MVGKWHVGHGHDWMVPWRRGFQTYSGYLAGAEDHYTRMWCMEGTEWCGVDYSEHSDTFTGPTNETWGIYSAGNGYNGFKAKRNTDILFQYFL